MLDEGELDLTPRLAYGKLELQIDDRGGDSTVVREPSEIVLHAGPATKKDLIGPAYPILGDTLLSAYFFNGWENAGQIFAPEPGWNGTEAGADTEVRLAGFEGPGRFAMYTYTREMDNNDESPVQHLNSGDSAHSAFTLRSSRSSSSRAPSRSTDVTPSIQAAGREPLPPHYRPAAAVLTFELRLRCRQPHPVPHDDPAPQLRLSPPGAHRPRRHAQVHKGRLFRTRIAAELARERIRGILRHIPRGMALRLPLQQHHIEAVRQRQPYTRLLAHIARRGRPRTGTHPHRLPVPQEPQRHLVRTMIRMGRRHPHVALRAKPFQHVAPALYRIATNDLRRFHERRP